MLLARPTGLLKPPVVSLPTPTDAFQCQKLQAYETAHQCGGIYSLCIGENCGRKRKRLTINGYCCPGALNSTTMVFSTSMGWPFNRKGS